MTDPDPIMGAHVSDWSSEDSIEGPFDRSPAWLVIPLIILALGLGLIMKTLKEWNRR